MKSNQNNYAFIDGQNLNLGIQSLGWKLDYRRFRKYLKEKYDKAVIVTSDGDFYSLIKHLYLHNKLKTLISPYVNTCSVLLKKTAKEKIIFMDNLRKKLEYKEKHR